jgi:hypothetical protein
MLIDNIMPLYHFNEVQYFIIRTSSRTNILNAVRDVTPKEIPFLFELFWLRGLPSLIILGKRYKFSINRKRSLFEQLLTSGFILLAEGGKPRTCNRWNRIVLEIVGRIVSYSSEYSRIYFI